MEKKVQKISIWKIMAYFIIYCFIGFVVETLFALINYNVIESRKSFLYGPLLRNIWSRGSSTNLIT